MTKQAIIEAGLQGLNAWFSGHAQPGFRAKQVWDWIFTRRAVEFAQMTDLPLPIRAALHDEFTPLKSQVAEVHQTADQTQKLLVSLGNGDQVECVLLAEAKRRTVCVSTQV